MLEPTTFTQPVSCVQFMNTKVLFKTVRHMPRAQQPKPVMVRVASARDMLLCGAPGNWAIVHF